MVRTSIFLPFFTVLSTFAFSMAGLCSPYEPSDPFLTTLISYGLCFYLTLILNIVCGLSLIIDSRRNDVNTLAMPLLYRVPSLLMALWATLNTGMVFPYFIIFLLLDNDISSTSMETISMSFWFIAHAITLASIWLSIEVVDAKRKLFDYELKITQLNSHNKS